MFLINGKESFKISDMENLVVVGAKADSDGIFSSPTLQLISPERTVWSTTVEGLQENTFSESKTSIDVDFKAYLWKANSLIILAGDQKFAILSVKNGRVLNQEKFDFFEPSTRLNYLDFIEVESSSLLILTTFAIFGIHESGATSWIYKGRDLLKYASCHGSQRDLNVVFYDVMDLENPTKAIVLDTKTGQVLTREA